MVKAIKAIKLYKSRKNIHSAPRLPRWIKGVLLLTKGKGKGKEMSKGGEGKGRRKEGEREGTKGRQRDGKLEP